MKHAKRIVALICVLVICFTLTAAPSANAQGLLSGQQFGAWISAGLVAANILWSVTPFASGTQNFHQWLSDPFMTEGSYTYPPSTLQNYLNAATIKVDQGVTTIDGVVYDELFVEPGTFMTGLKTNLFDFKTKFNILSGQSGITLASGAGYYSGIPVYNVGNILRTQTYTFPENLDKNNTINEKFFDFYYHSRGNVNPPYDKTNYGVSASASLSIPFQSPQGHAPTWYLYQPNPNANWVARGYNTTSTFYSGRFTSNPFSYNYTSGVVPAESTDIPDNFGMSIQIPHDKLETFYNTYPQYNVDNSVINIEQDQVDIDELTQAIFDLVDSVDDLKVEFAAEKEPEPEPPAPIEDVLEGLNVIAQQQFEQMQQQEQLHQEQQQTQQQQLQEQQQISQNTSEINDTIKDVTAVPDAEHLPDFKFDLRELFPFCIPFDIYRLLSRFDAEPLAPHVQIPFVIESLGFRYDIDLDFSVFDPVAEVLRTVEFIVYALGLAWATGKVIKW